MYPALLVASFLLAAEPAGPQTFPLWPGKIPGPTSKDADNVPTLSVHKAPADKANGCAVVVCPGGAAA